MILLMYEYYDDWRVIGIYESTSDAIDARHAHEKTLDEYEPASYLIYDLKVGETAVGYGHVYETL